jgi:hypothetical protein
MGKMQEKRVSFMGLPLASSAPSFPTGASVLTAHVPCGCLCLRSDRLAESQQKYFVLKTSAFPGII